MDDSYKAWERVEIFILGEGRLQFKKGDKITKETLEKYIEWYNENYEKATELQDELYYDILQNKISTTDELKKESEEKGEPVPLGEGVNPRQ